MLALTIAGIGLPYVAMTAAMMAIMFSALHPKEVAPRLVDRISLIFLGLGLSFVLIAPFLKMAYSDAYFRFPGIEAGVLTGGIGILLNVMSHFWFNHRNDIKERTALISAA